VELGNANDADKPVPVVLRGTAAKIEVDEEERRE